MRGGVEGREGAGKRGGGGEVGGEEVRLRRGGVGLRREEMGKSKGWGSGRMEGEMRGGGEESVIEWGWGVQVW